MIDRFFPRDPRFAINRQLLDRLGEIDAGLSHFSLLELCGIASFNLSAIELNRWLFAFEQIYPIRIVTPRGLSNETAADAWFVNFTVAVMSRIARQSTWGDAVIVLAAEEFGATSIITWNPRHFVGRTSTPVYTPESFLKAA